MNNYLPLIPLVVFFILGLIKYGRNQIINRFFYTDTISPQSAKQFKDVGVTDLLLAKILIFRGILKTAGNNLYYLDLDRKYQIEKSYEKLLVGIVALAIIFLVVAIFVVFIR